MIRRLIFGTRTETLSYEYCSYVSARVHNYYVLLIGISETKWFGDDVFEMNGYTVIYLGHSVPQSGDTVQCGEGVAIVLNPVMATSWRDSGASWSAISSKIVSARLQLCLSDSALPL